MYGWFLGLHLVLALWRSIVSFLLSNFLAEEERVGRGYLCSVSLRHGVVSWSAVYDCGIFWSFVHYAISVNLYQF